MSKWNNIPYEFLHHILSQLESNKEVHQCLHVNKQWFAMCQPFLYKSITIKDLNKEDNLINTLLHSSYGSGQIVKSITFSNSFKAPVENLKHIDPSKDPLHLLMLKCPHVEEVDISKPLSSLTQIEYFFIALKNSSWKLRVIPGVYIFQDDINIYNRFADMMEDSLTHITVENWGKDERHYSYLKEYPKLSSVKLKYYATISDCSQVIENIPLLESLQVDFSERVGAAEIDLTDDMLNIMQPFPNIKKLHMNEFGPLYDNELTFIVDKFPDVVDLSIDTDQRDWIDEEEYNPFVILDFLKYVIRIPKHSITINHFQNIELLKLYYNAFGDSTFNLVFVGQLRGEEDNTILCYGDELTLTVKYSNPQHHMAHFSSSMIYLANVKDHIQNLGLRFDPEFGEINRYLDYAFANCPQLRRLEIVQGTLKSLPFDMTSKCRPISHLTLHRVTLSENSLHYLSKGLPYLESLKFEGCEFLGHSNGNGSDENEDGEDVRMTEILTQYYCDITMSSTDFKSIEIASSHLLDLKYILVEITQFSNAVREYHIFQVDGMYTWKVDKNEFESTVNSTTNSSNMIMIELVASSVETLKFSAPGGIQFKLEF